MHSNARSKSSKFGGKAKKGGSWLRTIVEFALFLGWLIFTGIGGYFVGHAPISQNCPPDLAAEIAANAKAVKPKCIPNTKPSQGVGIGIGAVDKPGGYTIDELKAMWQCSHAVSNFSQATDRIYPSNKGMEQTKWKSIISVEPKAFFDKYLSQVTRPSTVAYFWRKERSNIL